MGENADYLETIKQAQLGSRDSMSRLAEEARGRVFVYIYRVTLDYHLAEELSQETILEMLKSLKRLKIESVNAFWAWLYRTAMGKIQHHFRCQGSRRIEQKTAFSSWELLKNVPKDNKGGLEALLHKELSQMVLKAMGQMKVSYRNVLTLRCFDEMSYAEIASVTGGTEIQAMVQFFRAKRSLKKQLAQNGFRKEHLLPAIGLFGSITGFTAKSASAAVTVSPTAAKVGITAATVGALTSKSGIVAAVTIAIMALSTVSIVKTFDIRVFSGSSNKSINEIVYTKAFENPSSLIMAYPDGGWQAADYTMQQQPAIPVLPQDLLVGPRQRNSYYVILPEGHWLELGFSGEIVDGPGIDICFDGRATGQPPLIFLTDGAGQEIQITSTPSYQNRADGYGFTAYDISGLSLPFKPRALRIVGADNQGSWGGAEIWAVWARVSK
jgi:RNA polymerase sigma-70 factor (ECF subfamily)